MRCGHSAFLLILSLLATLSFAVAPEPPSLFLGPVTFTSNLFDADSQEVLRQAFDTISNVHAEQVGRSRTVPYNPVQVLVEVLQNMQIRGDHHFGRGRAQLYELPYHTSEHGQVWVSLVKDSTNWIRREEGQEGPPTLALVWQTIDHKFSLRGAFGLSKTYANTVRNQVPAWRPVHHAVGGVQGFRQFRVSVQRLGHRDPSEP